jgi:Zn-dependent protease with chaperone function
VPLDGSAGFLLSLLTESFAVRALIGSLAVTGVAMFLVRRDVLRTRSARRLTVLAPILVAAVSAVAVARAGGAYLPQLWVASASPGPASQLLDLLGELRLVGPRNGRDLLGAAYAITVVVLLSRRLAGVRRTSRLLRAAQDGGAHPRVGPLLATLAARMRTTPPTVVLIEDCPGGAFALGVRQPLIAMDPGLVDSLDDQELEGLLAHELAHLKRRDPRLGMAVGVFRDLTFFLPPVHLAVRWLRQEQEQSADELAAEHTRRPGALASGILKVFVRQSRHGGWSPQPGCAAVASVAAERAVTDRLERLVERPRLVSQRRRVGEIAAATALVAAGSVAAWLVPGWVASSLDAYSLSFVYLSAPPVAEVESPAFATFRALTPSASSAVRTLPGPSAAPESRPLAEHLICPCIESISQLRSGVAATVADAVPRMLWRSPGHDAWEVANLRERVALRSRPLFALTDNGPQVGFFVVARSPVLP